MIRVSIELIPFGDESRPKTQLAVVEIGNMEKRNAAGETKYQVRLEGAPDRFIWHRREAGFWPLVR